MAGKRSSKRPTLAAVLASIKEPGAVTLHPFKSLTSAKSDYEKFCARYVPIFPSGFSADRHHLSRVCSDYPSRLFRKAIEQWQKNPTNGMRHWPWMAFTVNHYRHLRRESETADRPSPKDVIGLLRGIEGCTKDLIGALNRLQRLSSAAYGLSSQLADGHLEYLDQMIAQAAAGVPSATAETETNHLLFSMMGRMDFVKRLAQLQGTANFLSTRLSSELLRHKRPPEHPALRSLVSAARPLWTSLAGREPSINDTTKGQSDFVTFVQELAALVHTPLPSVKQIKVAFKSRPPPIITKLFP